MYEKDLKFDTAWSAPAYPHLKEEDKGVWRTVLDHDEHPVGVVWSNLNDASGVTWVTQTDQVTKLYKYFSTSAQGGFPAYAAYVNAKDVSGVKLGPEQSGLLSGVTAAIKVMMDDIDEASS